MLDKNLAIFQARRQVIDEIYEAVSQVLNAFYFTDAPHLNGVAIIILTPGGKSVLVWVPDRDERVKKRDRADTLGLLWWQRQDGHAG